MNAPPALPLRLMVAVRRHIYAYLDVADQKIVSLLLRRLDARQGDVDRWVMPTATDAKTRVLDAAWTLVARRGSAEITMAELADEVGISRQAIYLHFPNRATLFLAMVQRFDQIHGDAAARERRRALPAVEAFEAGLHYWFKYLPQVFPVARALEAAALRSADGAEAWHDRMAVLRDSMAFYVARLADQGRLAEGWTVKEATDWVWSRVHPSVWRHLVEERGWRPTTASKRLVRSILAELVSRAR